MNTLKEQILSVLVENNGLSLKDILKKMKTEDVLGITAQIKIMVNEGTLEQVSVSRLLSGSIDDEGYVYFVKDGISTLIKEICVTNVGILYSYYCILYENEGITKIEAAKKFMQVIGNLIKEEQILSQYLDKGYSLLGWSNTEYTRLFSALKDYEKSARSSCG